MLKVGDKAIVKNDDGRFFKGCRVVVKLNMSEKAKKYGDKKPLYVQTENGQCCGWYAEENLEKVEG